MDSFVTRRPRSPRDKKPTKRKESKLKQVTIESLSRVVVIEDILHLKSALENHKDDVFEDKLLEILQKLKSMNPSTKVLKDTKIGQSVNKLRKSEHKSVKELARCIVRSWKRIVIEENTKRECVDVQCDAKTEILRCKARKLISDGLNTTLTDPTTEVLEKRLFEKCERRVDNRYKRSVRSIVFCIKSDKNVQKNVRQGTMTPDHILSKCLYTESKK
ncbi:transcription elongation factor A N-terminal and central domain-containing protein 2-like [Dendronephthya gigantea]|uniref:transcription elongation factor A N-terminal and central domain-containing protein 2-like n=1 Tax=Dendronephthya gigantea TaxID=151771 RepID=UPI00106CE0DE|nr:transcription elongation factor A N-terminal and central domain-containing protein 2-like [Dendronephthya gigantea]